MVEDETLKKTFKTLSCAAMLYEHSSIVIKQSLAKQAYPSLSNNYR